MPKPPSRAADLGAVIEGHKNSKREKRPADGGSPVVAKSRDAGYVKLTVYVPRGLHTDLKIAAVRAGVEMSEIVANLIANWLKKEGSK